MEVEQSRLQATCNHMNVSYEEDDDNRTLLTRLRKAGYLDVYLSKYGVTVNDVLGDIQKIMKGPPGPPPHKGWVWHDETSRWRKPTGDSADNTALGDPKTGGGQRGGKYNTGDPSSHPIRGYEGDDVLNR